MKSQSERHAHWQKLVEEQIQSGLSRREFCDRNQIVLSQFSYYYLEFKKKEHRKISWVCGCAAHPSASRTFSSDITGDQGITTQWTPGIITLWRQ